MKSAAGAVVRFDPPFRWSHQARHRSCAAHLGEEPPDQSARAGSPHQPRSRARSASSRSVPRCFRRSQNRTGFESSSACAPVRWTSRSSPRRWRWSWKVL